MNYEEILHILGQSSQGFTPFEILDRLLVLPQYHGYSRGDAFSKLLSVLQNLRDSQVVTQVDSRWVLVDRQENISENSINESTLQNEAESTENNHDVAGYLDITVEKQTYTVNDNVFNIPIEKLNLRIRTYNCLKTAGINTIQELTECPEDSLLEIRNFGETSLTDVKSALAKFNPPFQPLETKKVENSKNTEIINDAVFDFPIETLNLPKKTYDFLKRSGISTIKILKAYSEERLLAIRDFGEDSLADVKSALANFQPPFQTVEIELENSKNTEIINN